MANIWRKQYFKNTPSSSQLNHTCYTPKLITNAVGINFIHSNNEHTIFFVLFLYFK